MDETSNAIPQALASWLESRLVEWEQARKPQELKMLECYQDVMRIPRDDDTQGTGAAKARKAKGLFIGSTRNKVRAARAKINDALFGNGKLPFDTSPTNEQLAPFADVLEDIITEQLERGKFREMLSTGTNTLATYGTGFVFGPFVRRETLTETYADNSAGFTEIKENKYEFDLPYFELGNTLDVYPDSEARDPKDAEGFFWVSMMSPHTVASWKADKSYRNIDEALKAHGDDGTLKGSDTAAQMRGNVDFWHKNGRIKVARYFGKVPRSALQEMPEDGSLDTERVDVVVIMAGGVVVKVDESPWGDKKPVHRCIYEAVEHEMWGVGVAENNMPHQKTVNAAFRLFNEGKGMALLGTKAVDRSKFMPTEDFKKYPGKVYQFKPGLSAEEKKEAIIDFQEPDVTGGWIDVIRLSEQFSDDDTGITKYTQGDDASHLNKTATGISMIMSASSLPIKEVIQHIDSMWIEPIIECLIEWNLKYLDPETVQKIHGNEHAQKWAQIKQFGKASFLEWKATGTSSFMAKEVLVSKIRAFAEFALSNPQSAQLVDVRELLEQTWDAMEIGKESPISKDDASKLPPQVKAQMEQMQQQVQQLGEALQNASAAVDEAESKKFIEERKLDIDAYKAETERMKALAPAITPEAVQALVVQTVQQMLTADQLANQSGLDQPGQMMPEQPMQQVLPSEMQEMPPDPAPMEMSQEPADAGFFTPEALPPGGMQ